MATSIFPGGTFGGNLGVRRYNPTTGAFIDFFANTGSDLYVTIGIDFVPITTFMSQRRTPIM
jgi:hypothetical protein